jgi:hypothetical protein
MLAVLATQIVRALDHASLARSSEIETTSRKISEGQKTRVQVGKKIQKSTPAKRKPRRASQSKNVRDNAIGAIDISEECKINVRVEGNQE